MSFGGNLGNTVGPGTPCSPTPSGHTVWNVHNDPLFSLTNGFAVTLSQ